MTRYEGHISALQGTLLVFAVLSAMLFVQFPEFLIQVGGPAAWQVVVVITVLALVLFLPMAALAERFPGKGLAEISEEAAGPVLGSLLTLSISAWLLWGAVLTVRAFTETLITAILPMTPPSVLILGVLACVGYASYAGLEPLSRATLILYPVLAAGSLLVLLLSLPRASVALLYPFWGHGLAVTIRSGVYFTGMAAEVVVALAVGYGFRSPRDLRTSGLGGILLFGSVTAVTVAVLVAVFGAPDASQLPFPMFNLARLVYLGPFFQRIESILVLFWFCASLVRLSVLFHCAVVSLSGALQVPYYRPVIFPLLIIVGAFSLLPKDFVTVLRIERDWVRPAGLLVMGVPILLLILAFLRGKGGGAHAA